MIWFTISPSAVVKKSFCGTLSQYFELFVLLSRNIEFFFISPGDSVGKTPEESKRLYDEVVTKHPQTILSVHHETHSKNPSFSIMGLC